MDSGGGSVCGVHEEDTGPKRSNQNCSRHNPQQIHYLETFFKECPHPDVKQRKRISRELGLEPCQIKFWFQNKRTLMKTQLERMDNNALRRENDRVKCENLAMKETLLNALCPTCGGPTVSEEEQKNHIRKLQLENADLKKEYERVATEVAHLTGKPISESNVLMSTGSPLVFSEEPVLCAGMSDSAGGVRISYCNSTFGASLSEPTSSDLKSVMVETAACAMDELLKVLRTDKPLWTNINGRHSLNKDCYEKVFMRPRHFKHSSTIKLESSKDSCNVAINAIVLVNMLLDSSMWLDLFPTLVTKLETLHIVETGTLVNRSGSLHLMHEIMHSISPPVAPREFYFLRYCQQVKIDTWAIVDVSIRVPGENDGNIVPNCWKLPSGCVIQDMPDGQSKVTWVELVEVDYRDSTHPLYRDLVTSGFVYGAERWIAALKQMCERAVLSNEVPAANTLGVNRSAEGKRSLMDLSHRMFKEFCSALSTQFIKVDLHHISERDNSGFQVSTRKCTYPFKAEGMIICVSTSLWLPMCPQHVFTFFQDNNMRSQWDFVTRGNPVKEIMRAVSGHNPENAVSVFQTVAPNESSSTGILQESLKDILGYYLVFAPLDLTLIGMSTTGLDLSTVPVLPSGCMITGGGRGACPKEVNNQFINKDVGSLLTVAFQFLLGDSAYTKQNYTDVVANASTQLKSTVEKIKAALSPSSSSKTTLQH